MGMDLVLLDDTTRRVTGSVGFWDSLIWTERYNDLGEFQLKTPYVSYGMNELIKGKYIGIRQSEQPMRIETQVIDIDDDGKEILTVSGRAMECVLEDRTNLNAIAAIGTTTATASYTTTNVQLAIFNLLKDHINGAAVLPLIDDKIDEITIESEFTEATSPGYTLAITRGELYATIQPLLEQTNYGLRGIRAKGTDSGFIISLYKGSDKTSTVIFRTAQGHIKVKSYLFSIKDSKTEVYIQTIYGAAFGSIPGIVGSPSGVDRRVLYVDGSDIDTAAGAPLTAMMKQKGQSELLKHKKINTFDFEVLPNIPYVFGTDYYLGDLIRVEADYGLSQNMRVSEFIRTEDEQGYREFPTLVEDIPAEYV